MTAWDASVNKVTVRSSLASAGGLKVPCPLKGATLLVVTEEGMGPEGFLRR